VYLATLDGRIVKSLVNRNATKFAKDLLWWLILSIPVSLISSGMKFLEDQLLLNLRTRLTTHFHRLYMSNYTFYKLRFNDTQNMTAEKIVTEDIPRFCAGLTNLWGDFLKPSFRIIFPWSLCPICHFSSPKIFSEFSRTYNSPQTIRGRLKCFI